MLALFSLLLLGCGKPGSGPAPQLGELALSLRSPDGRYQIDGSVSVVRQGSPAFSRTLVLDGEQQRQSLTVPVGAYLVSLDAGFRLMRLDGNLASDLTARVTSHQLAPNPAQVAEDQTTLVTLTLSLDDDTVLVFGAGEFAFVLDVVDDGLSCGGCAPGRRCLTHADGRTECATACDPSGSLPPCPANFVCNAGHFSADAAGELQPLFTCRPGAGPSGEDTTPPLLTGLSLSPASLDTSSGDATLTVTLSATDDLSGIALAQVLFFSPSRSLVRACSAGVAGQSAGTFTCQAVFPALSEPGTWELTVSLFDAVGNQRNLDAPTLVALGLPSTLELSSVHDASAPLLTGLSLSPAQLDTSSGDATLTVTLSATDDLSGITLAQVLFFSPSRSLVRACSAGVAAQTEATFTCEAVFPAFSEAGTWELTVSLFDAVGNQRTLDAPTLTALGFPASIENAPN